MGRKPRPGSSPKSTVLYRDPKTRHGSEHARSRCLAGSHVNTVYPAHYPELSQVCINHTFSSWRAGHRNESCVYPSVSHSVTHIRTGAEATLARFWKTVDLQERGEVLSISLDSRSLKTPAGKPLLLPRSKRLAATLIVTEWENQRDVLKSHALPMVCDLC
jgi:ATP12 chaperone protein